MLTRLLQALKRRRLQRHGFSLDAVPASTVTFNLNGGGTKAAVSATVVSNTDLTSVLDAINALSGTTEVTATFDGTDKSKLILTDADGDDIFIEHFSETGTATTLRPCRGSWKLRWHIMGSRGRCRKRCYWRKSDDAIVSGVVRMESSQAFTVSDQECGYRRQYSRLQGTSVHNAGGTATLSAVSSLSVATTAGAQSAIAVIDGALGRVNEVRSELGAVSTVLDHTISNLGNVVINTEASQSRIEDADFAKVTGDLTKSQIMSQAATAMLAQANASKQGVLSLLQG